MSEFFEPPPPPKESERPRRRMHPWVQAPPGTLPGVVALELVLARTEHAAVCVSRVGGYPSGFELDLVTMAAADRDDLDPHLFGGRAMFRRQPGGRSAADGTIPPELLRFGVEFADGAKATNTSGRLDWATEAPPPGPVLTPGGGGGGGGNWRQTVWVWPLPPPGRLTLVCEWPAAAIALTRHELDAQLILDAAARAEIVFPEAEIANSAATQAVSARSPSVRSATPGSDT